MTDIAGSIPARVAEYQRLRFAVEKHITAATKAAFDLQQQGHVAYFGYDAAKGQLSFECVYQSGDVSRETLEPVYVAQPK